MRRTYFLLSFILVSLCETSCNHDANFLPKSEVNQEIRKSYLVDKIYDGDDKLLAEYFYDSKNNLVEIKTLNPNDNTLNFTKFEYEDGKVSNISYSSSLPNQKITYNTDGKIEKVIYNYKSTNGLQTHEKNFLYNKNGVLQEYRGIKYTVDENHNIVRNNFVVKTNLGSSGYENVENRFEYDTNPRPNFNIDYLFIFEPFPNFGDVAPIEKNYSQNNMLNIANSTNWKYEYNDHGLPIKISTLWSENKIAFSLKIVYQRINI